MEKDNCFNKLLDEHFENYTISQIQGGETDAALYKITTDQNYIVKKQSSSLNTEYLNYVWLQGKVPVPEIVFYSKAKEYELLCMTELRGQPLDHYIGILEDREIVKRYAKSLKLLHSLNVNSDAVVQSLDKRISAAAYNIKNNLVDHSQLQPGNMQYGPDQLFEKLLQLQPADFELVFTHGDYCFDNIIFDPEKLTGFIDLGNGGIADKYQDIALAVRSIRDNFDDELENLFFDVYGLNEINEVKLEFYTLLDEFF